LENKRLQEEIGQKDDEIVLPSTELRWQQDYLQDQLAEEKKKLEEMESRRGPADDDELAQQMEESHREIQSLTKVSIPSPKTLVQILMIENLRSRVSTTTRAQRIRHRKRPTPIHGRRT
jgi:hypothetical protein